MKPIPSLPGRQAIHHHLRWKERAKDTAETDELLKSFYISFLYAALAEPPCTPQVSCKFCQLLGVLLGQRVSGSSLKCQCHLV